MGKGQERGVASGKTGSHYSLGQSSPGSSRSTQGVAVPDQGAAGRPRCPLEGQHYHLCGLAERGQAGRATTTLLPYPGQTNSKQPATLSCAVTRLKLESLMPTAEDAIRLTPPQWSLAEVKTSNLENAGWKHLSRLPQLPAEAKETEGRSG